MSDVTVNRAAMAVDNPPPAIAVHRYTATAQALHWVVAVLMFVVVPLAWVMVNLPRTAPWREELYTLHKSIGLTILALVAVRLAWRATHPAPALPGRMARWEQAGAFASHWLLYLILVGMPVSGYLLSAAGWQSRHLLRPIHLAWAIHQSGTAARRDLDSRRHRSVGGLRAGGAALDCHGLARGGAPGWSAGSHAASAGGGAVMRSGGAKLPPRWVVSRFELPQPSTAYSASANKCAVGWTWRKAQSPRSQPT